MKGSLSKMISGGPAINGLSIEGTTFGGLKFSPFGKKSLGVPAGTIRDAFAGKTFGLR